ncbi:MAG: c-type cytochrome [Archangiaceae bacterium]|nr:c-type cytochrome [Archangiaceae bacterium]
MMAAVGGLAVLVAMSGCSSGNSSPRSSGSLGVSNDSQYLYAADTDNGALFVVDAKTLGVVQQVQVGVRPFRVSVGKDDTIFVANRGSRSVSVISHGDWQVVGEIATGVDPVGMQVSPDGKYLYVVSATASDDTEYGILQQIDTATLTEKWRLPVGDEPRGLALINDDRALVSLYRAGDVVRVDLKNGKVVDAAGSIDLHSKINQQALTTTTQYGTPGTTSTYQPRAMTDLAVTPDGKRVFATSLLSREAPILTQPTPATPYYASQGPRLAGSVATPALFTFDTSSNAVTPLVEDVSSTSYYPGYGYDPYNQGNQADVGYPQTTFAVSGLAGYGAGGGSTTASPVLQGPSVAVVDITGSWLFMVNRDSSNVAVISTMRHEAKPDRQQNNNNYSYYAAPNELPSVHSTASIGKGADGIAILGDNSSAYVYNQFDHSVQRLTLDESSSSIVAGETSKVTTVETLTAQQISGRNLFHDSNDRRVSAVQASVACSSCHLEGRDDAHVWQFPDGPRQTPTLAGRGMSHTAPYHWSGEFADLPAFLTHTITSRMGGTGLNAQAEQNLNAYVESIPAPENPYRVGTELTDQQARGAVVFAAAECGTCHAGQWLTNNQFADVGTLSRPTTGYGDNGMVLSRGLNVPSLLGIARSAPYLHTGKAVSLKERLMSNPGDLHGKTSKLSSEQMDDLVAYLRTL